MKPSLSYLTISVLLGLSLMAHRAAPAQSKESKESGGSIAGRVMIGDRPAAGVVVAALPTTEALPGDLGRVRTEADGRYRLTGVRAGNCRVLPLAPGFIFPGDDRSGDQAGRAVTLSEGESVEGIDFTLVRGGVITGRVTDAEHQPVAGEYVTLTMIDERGQKRRSSGGSSRETDDRGVYRVYGLPAGRYLVSAGVGGEDDGARVLAARRRGNLYRRTYHPAATEEARAKIIEVTPGSEATDIDITLAGSLQRHRVQARVVEAETGQPVPGVSVGYGQVMKGQNWLNSSRAFEISDAKGQVYYHGLLPGRYALFLMPGRGAPEFYSDLTFFDVIDGGVTGVEIKARRGAAINGLIVVEGTTDPAILAFLPQLWLNADSVERKELVAFFNNSAQVNPDGSFRLAGLPPGKVRVRFGRSAAPKGLSFVRLERDGVPVRDGIIEVAAGEQVTGVRAVFTYAAGVVRGQVQITGGALPEGTQMRVFAVRVDAQIRGDWPSAEVDARGRFVLEGLAAGEWVLNVNAFAPAVAAPGSPPRLPTVRQAIRVTGSGEVQVVINYDLTPKEKQQ